MLYVVMFVLGLAVAYAVIRFVPKARANVCEGWESAPAPEIPGPDSPGDLQAAVESLHWILFGGAAVAGTLDGYYNAIWKAAGLEESGAPK